MSNPRILQTYTSATAWVIARALGILLILVLAIPFFWTLFTGDSLLKVTGESMKPTYQIGDVLIVQKPEGNELQEQGAIVVAKRAGADADELYVHRVDDVTETGAWLRGDNNDSRDPVPVTQDDIVGTPRFVVTGVMGSILLESQSVLARILLGAAAVALLIVPKPASLRAQREEEQPLEATV